MLWTGKKFSAARREFMKRAAVAGAALAAPGEAAAAQQTTIAAPPGTSARTGSADNGKKLFVKYGCYECHGREGQGGVAFGPRLALDPIAYAAFVRYVRAPRGEMPPYSDKLITSEQDLADIHAFLASRPPAAPATVLPPE